MNNAACLIPDVLMDRSTRFIDIHQGALRGRRIASRFNFLQGGFLALERKKTPR